MTKFVFFETFEAVGVFYTRNVLFWQPMVCKYIFCTFRVIEGNMRSHYPAVSLPHSHLD